jgi:NAD(P)-dependent dehydrogenase (short-subunit alcohol dehydrogenase family)
MLALTMNLHLNGKTALVMGASMGIGHAIARGLAAEGVRLAVAARRKDPLEAPAGQVIADGVERPQLMEQHMMAYDAASILAVQPTSEGLPASMPHFKSGKLRAIAVGTASWPRSARPRTAPKAGTTPQRRMPRTLRSSNGCGR